MGVFCASIFSYFGVFYAEIYPFFGRFFVRRIAQRPRAGAVTVVAITTT